jgi:hypothetical protein
VQKAIVEKVKDALAERSRKKDEGANNRNASEPPNKVKPYVKIDGCRPETDRPSVRG